MANPFKVCDIVSSDFKRLHKDAIDYLLDQVVGGRKCDLLYGITKWEDCPSCSGGIAKKSSNVFQHGGRVPLHGQKCGMCDGTGKKPVESSEEIILFPIWGALDITKELVPVLADVQSSADLVLTIGKFGLLPKIRRAKEIIISKDIQNILRYRCEKNGESKPAGFSDDWVISPWKRIG